MVERTEKFDDKSWRLAFVSRTTLLRWGAVISTGFFLFVTSGRLQGQTVAGPALELKLEASLDENSTHTLHFKATLINNGGQTVELSHTPSYPSAAIRNYSDCFLRGDKISN